MTTKELNKRKKMASHLMLSPFAKFCQALRGYDVFRHGTKLDKWEAFAICKNPEIILNSERGFWLEENDNLKAVNRGS